MSMTIGFGLTAIVFAILWHGAAPNDWILVWLLPALFFAIATVVSGVLA